MSEIYIPPEYNIQEISQNEAQIIADELKIKEFEVKLKENLEKITIDQIRQANRNDEFDNLLLSILDNTLSTYNKSEQTFFKNKYTIDEIKGLLTSIQFSKAENTIDAIKTVNEARKLDLSQNDIVELANSFNTSFELMCDVVVGGADSSSFESDLTKKSEKKMFKSGCDAISITKAIKGHAARKIFNSKNKEKIIQNATNFKNSVSGTGKKIFSSITSNVKNATGTVISGLTTTGILTGGVGGGTIALGPVGLVILIVILVTIGVVLTLIGAILGTYLIIKRNPHVQGMVKVYYMTHGFTLGWFYVIYYLIAYFST